MQCANKINEVKIRDIVLAFFELKVRNAVVSIGRGEKQKHKNSRP